MKKLRPFFVISVLISFLFVQAAQAIDEGFQTRPILLGTSGGSIRDSGIGFCCGGTLGALVQDSQGVQYILSNNHVLARTNRGFPKEAIIQPGLIDQEPACFRDSGDAVANLSDYVPISFRRNTVNQVDAAIAGVQIGKVDPSGSILDVEEVSSVTVAPMVGMSVKKSGRTTGLTSGIITAVDVTVDIEYPRLCGMNLSPRIARFTGQIMIRSAGFSAGGDSGSLIVEDCSSHPRAVGLLFGGSDSSTLANPIGDVLTQLSVSMVGTSGFCTSSAGSPAMTTQVPAQVDRVELENAKGIKERNKEATLAVPGVVGMGIGLSETAPGKIAIEVYVKEPAHAMKGRIPERLETIPVKIVETGKFVAY